MAKRYKLPLGKSKRIFTRHAGKPHPKNAMLLGPMRGGIRL